MSLLPHSPEEIFHRLLDESAALLAAPEQAGMAIPDDELHREIIVPLLPAMLGDKSIREHWSGQAATGFPARIGRHFENGAPPPRWTPGDFEIHVTASYSAGADARALADTLLSEESLREMTAALMNQLLDALWPSLAPASKVPQLGEIPVAASTAVPEPILPPETAPATAPPVEIAEEILVHADQPAPVWQQPSRAMIHALCRKLPSIAVWRGFAANNASHGASAAIVARRILQRARLAVKTPQPTSSRRLPRRASL